MNSLEIYFDKQNSPGVMAAKLWINNGSRADPKEQKGIHQLLGSILCRGCGPYNHIQVAEIVEGCGASLHCETYEDGILITLKCIKDDAYRLLPVLGWMVKKPHIETDQIKLEKELTIQALNRQREDPFYVAFDGWRRISFGDGPYGHDPLGCLKGLSKLTKRELLPLSQDIQMRRKVLVISGTYPEDLEQKINELEPFNSLLNKAVPKTKQIFKYKSISNQTTNLNLQFEETSQVILMFGQPTIGYGHKDAICLQLLSCYLGLGMSSKLFIELRENHGVAYDVGVHHPIREYDSPFVFHASTSEEKSIHTLELLQKTLKTILSRGLSEKDLLLSKSKYQGQIAHLTQTVSQKAERKALLLGLNLDFNHDQKNIGSLKKISSKDLLQSANKYLQRPLLCLCGPKNTVLKIADRWNNS